jgi:hypothetical protein
MHTIITLLWTREQIHFDQPWAVIDGTMIKMGTLEIKGEGVRRIVPKSTFYCIHEFTDDAWAKVQADGEAQRKAQESTQVRQRAVAANKAWRALPWWKRVGRREPVTLPEVKGARGCGR